MRTDLPSANNSYSAFINIWPGLLHAGTKDSFLEIEEENGGPCATRTRDQLVKSQLLYQLS